jgi:iron complex outermembrane receptor protein
LYYNQYSELRSNVFGTPTCQPSGVPASVPLDPACFAGAAPYVELPLVFVNKHDQNNYGAELAVSYMPLDWWRLDGAYTYLHLGAQDVLPFSVGQDSPENQFSLRSAMDMNANTRFDLWLRFVDELESQGVDAYTTIDAQLSYVPIPSLRLSLVGRNLLNDGHVEFVEEFGINQATEVPREGYFELQWQF